MSAALTKTPRGAVLLRQRQIAYAGTPFRHQLRNEFEGRAGKLLRLVHGDRVVRVYPSLDVAELANLRSFTTLMRRTGLNVPGYDVILAPRWDNPHKPGYYVVVDAIAGERLDEIARPGSLDGLLPIPRRFFAAFYVQVDEMLASLFNYYSHLIACGGLAFTVMDQSQFMYGNRKTDRAPAVYFVDLDPTYVPVLPLAAYDSALKSNAVKLNFEQPLNMYFEMRLLHPNAPFPRSLEVARRYFQACLQHFQDFYSATSTPRWARGPNFLRYQRMKEGLNPDVTTAASAD